MEVIIDLYQYIYGDIIIYVNFVIICLQMLNNALKENAQFYFAENVFRKIKCLLVPSLLR
jgi:hypothetical protein